MSKSSKRQQPTIHHTFYNPIGGYFPYYHATTSISCPDKRQRHTFPKITPSILINQTIIRGQSRQKTVLSRILQNKAQSYHDLFKSRGFPFWCIKSRVKLDRIKKQGFYYHSSVTRHASLLFPAKRGIPLYIIPHLYRKMVSHL